MAGSDSRRLLRIIAIFKFIKAALLVGAGVGALHLVKLDVFEYATDLVRKFHLNPGNHFVAEALARATTITPKRLHEFGVIAFIYAALFMAEGIGLWSLKRWGEWITVVITSSLLPFEVYELWHRFTFPKAAVLLINVAVVCYLVMRLRRKTTSTTEARSHGESEGKPTRQVTGNRQQVTGEPKAQQTLPLI